MSDSIAHLRGTERHIAHTLRIPAQVYTQIKQEAEEQQRSFNWIAVRLLMAGLEQEKQAE